MQALAAADKAGAADDARALAKMISEMDAPQEQPGFFSRLATNYQKEVGEGLAGMKEGAAQVMAEDATLGERALGAGKTALGALQYAASPIEAASRTIVADPVENLAKVAGASAETAKLIGDTTNLGAQVFSAAPAAKAIKAGAEATKEAVSTARQVWQAAKKQPAMTGEQLRAASQDAYRAAANSGVVINPQSFHSFMDDLPNNIEGFHPTITPQVAPKATSIMQAMRAQSESGAPLTLSELDTMRQAIGKAAAKNADANEGRIMGEIRDGLDEYIDNLQQSDLSPFTSQRDSNRAIGELKAAREMWRRSKKIEDIEDILAPADALGDPNYVQNKFRSILKNKRQFRRYTDEEKKLIRKIAKTGKIEMLGRALSPSGSDLTSTARLMGGSGVGFLVGGPAGAAIVPPAALAVRVGGNALRRNRIEALKETIARGGTPEPDIIQRLRAARAAARGAP